MSSYEADFWQDCANTHHEEEKQFVYATRMGLRAQWNVAHPPTYDLEGRSVIDIGGGPVSLLLKCINRGESVVADPAEYPSWVRARYAECGIEYWPIAGEKLADEHSFDEAWIYNVLQHVEDPALVVSNARRIAKTVRIFEWINVPAYAGHPNMLETEVLDFWLGGNGFEVSLNERGACGRAYYGVFSQ